MIYFDRRLKCNNSTEMRKGTSNQRYTVAIHFHLNIPPMKQNFLQVSIKNETFSAISAAIEICTAYPSAKKK